MKTIIAINQRKINHRTSFPELLHLRRCSIAVFLQQILFDCKNKDENLTRPVNFWYHVL